MGKKAHMSFFSKLKKNSNAKLIAAGIGVLAMHRFGANQLTLHLAQLLRIDQEWKVLRSTQAPWKPACGSSEWLKPVFGS